MTVWKNITNYFRCAERAPEIEAARAAYHEALTAWQMANAGVLPAGNWDIQRAYDARMKIPQERAKEVERLRLREEALARTLPVLQDAHDALMRALGYY